jgi:transposase
MPKQAIAIQLSEKDRALLLENTKPRIQYRFVQRARVILLAADRHQNNDIAERVGLSFVAVCKWRQRYAKHGIVGLKDKVGRGRPKQLTHDQILQVVETACKKPTNKTHWSLRALSDELGFVKKSRLQQILKGFDLKPHQHQMWCFSNDPNYEQKKADIVGLYLNPPENAFIVCIDEKSCIQALSRRTQPMQKGKPERINHEYKRNGTIDLFAAFRVNDGKVIGQIEERHRAIEFLKFIKIVYKKWNRKKRDLHIVLDNLKTHEVEAVQAWLGKHQNVHFHFTPTHASWLNQIELWFSILERQLLKRDTSNNTQELGTKIINYIEGYNKKAKPFAWCYGQPLKI